MLHVDKELLKKIGLATAFVGFAVLMGFVIYRVFFGPLINPPTVGTNANGNTNGSGNLPSTNVNGSAGVITTNINGKTTTVLPSIDTVARGGNTLATPVPIGSPASFDVTERGPQFYDSGDGKFYALNNKGEKVALTDASYLAAENITWNPSGDQAIIEFPDGSNVMYDFNTQTQSTLPKEMQDFSFSPTGDEVAFKFLTHDRDDRWLGVSTPDGSQSRGISLLGDNEDKVKVDWSPSGQVVALMNKSINGIDNEVFFVGLNGENFKSTIVQGRGFESKWSPLGDTILYSVYSDETDYNPQIWVVNALGDDIGKNRTNLGITTWADKCTFSSNTTIYCAVPQNLEYGSGLVPGIADDTSDVIYRIDTSTGSKTIVANPVDAKGQNDLTVEALYLSPDGKTLYLKDKRSGGIRSIQLQ